MFGVLTMHLTRLVNHGNSYSGAEDIFHLLCKNPLNHSFFHLFQPQRNKIPFPSPPNNSAGLSNFHFIEFDRDTGAAAGKYHSNIGTEVLLESHPTNGLMKKRVQNEASK